MTPETSQPRASAGYTFSAILGILKKIGIYKEIAQKNIDETIEILKKHIDDLKPESPIRKNIAKQILRENINKKNIIINLNFLKKVLLLIQNVFK